jgi:uncharacterized membrane protein
MTSSPSPDVDPRRVRIGLVFLTVVVVVALVIAVVVDDVVARVLMIGIALFTVARAYLIARALRRGGGRLAP